MGADYSQPSELDCDVTFEKPSCMFSIAKAMLPDDLQWLLDAWYEETANADVKEHLTDDPDCTPPGELCSYHRSARVKVYRKEEEKKEEESAANPFEEVGDVYLGEWICSSGQRVLYHPSQSCKISVSLFVPSLPWCLRSSITIPRGKVWGVCLMR